MYLFLQVTGLKLVAVMDETHAGDNFFGVKVLSFLDGAQHECVPLVIASLKCRKELLQALRGLGADTGRIFSAACGYND
jgi:hypothetical protein